MTGAAPKFGLRLAAVRMQDFRSLHDVAVRFTKGTTVLVGENNSGKTSLLEALAIALGGRRARPEDLYVGPSGRASSFEIDIRVEPFDGDEFPDNVRDIIGNGIQLDDIDFFNIRLLGELSPDGWDMTMKRSFIKGWETKRQDAAQLDVLDTPIVGRKALELLFFDMLDARRDIVEQLRNRNSYWGRTTKNVAIQEQAKIELEASLKKLGEEVTANSQVLTQVKADLADLSEALAAGKLDVELEALPRNVDDLIRAMDIVITSPSSSAFPVDSHGMGTRSLAALLVFRSFVNVVRPRLRADRLLSVAGFEEPEAHLHPQAQRAVFKILSEIGGQRIVSTHSTHVASIAELDAYRVFRREGATTVVSEIDPATSASWSADHVRRFIQVQNPEVLFAKAVGIVEGQTEADAFPVFAIAWWPPRGADGVGLSLIYTAGAGNSKHIVPFLDGLGIPWVIFCDGDDAGDDGIAACGNALGRTLDRSSPEVVQLPAGQAFEDYLLAGGFEPVATKAADQHPNGPLHHYKTTRDGQPRKAKYGGGTRNYGGAQGDSEATLDFLRDNKGSIGRLLAHEIVLAHGKDGLPERVKEFFSRLDTLRGQPGA